MKVTLKDFVLTTEHPASSYGQPVLIDEENEPYGPGDLLCQCENGCITGVILATDLVRQLAEDADLDAPGRAMVARFCGLLEEEA